MEYQILAMHVTQIQGLRVVFVAVDRTNNFWKVYRSNKMFGCGYPIHDTKNIDDNLFQSIARTGIAVDKKTALKYFPDLTKRYNEN